MVLQPQLPANVHVSRHPCLVAKLSQLRSKDTGAKDVKRLIHEITLIVGCEALAQAVVANPGGHDVTPLGFEYQTATILPETISLVPVLRSGLGMVDAIETILPNPVPIHHLGLYREPATLDPVEYYNNLPNHITEGTGSASRLAIILDPVIATGGTCAAAIQTLREWGAQRIIVLALVGAVPGVVRAAEEWPEGVEVWLAGIDQELTDKGMLKPGLGDVGDRLFLTIGK